MQGIFSMKTKIIYISGAEVFDMAEIRGAFDEVRAALGLNNDTVLFGVPVDNDDALGNANTTDATVADDMPEIVTEVIPEPVIEKNTAEEIAEPEIIIENSPIAEIPAEEKPKKTTRKPRARAKAAKTEAAAEPDSAQNAPDIAAAQEAAPVIPILSVLASKATVEEHAVTGGATEIADNDITAEEIIKSADIIDETSMVTSENAQQEPVAVIEDINVDAELITPADVADDDAVAQRVTIGDMINDDIPAAPVEKTLEQLLESMKPLREDHIEAEDAPDAQPTADIAVETFEDTNETDATLERLAAEFAENQDKIVASPRAENHGKIGKLKNILPFKKVKRDDTGLMGDLFGWAGIAANDEEFSIPGFFTNAASKK